MNSAYHDLEDLKKFLEDHVANRILLKVPNDEYQDETYQMNLIHPPVSIMKARRINNDPNQYISVPQIIIRLLNITENKVDGSQFYHYRDYNITLEVAVWNNGIHTDELYQYDHTDLNGVHFSTKDEPNHFFPSEDGAKDVIELCDMIIQSLSSHEWLNENKSLYLVDEAPITTGPINNENGPADLEPLFVHLIEFQMRSFIERNPFDSRGGLMERRKNG